jgi:hypothetical protein
MEKEREQLQATGIGIQPMTMPNEASPAHLQAPAASHKNVPPSTSAVAPRTLNTSSQQVSQIPLQQASKNSSQQPSTPNEPSATGITPSRTTQQQHQVIAALPHGATKTAQGRPVPLPGDSHNHGTSSSVAARALGTGGDQTNAIYLELRQLGFACWYDNRADDLTKEGMRQGIVHAAAFLLFLSKARGARQAIL